MNRRIYIGLDFRRTEFTSLRSVWQGPMSNFTVDGQGEQESASLSRTSQIV